MQTKEAEYSIVSAKSSIRVRHKIIVSSTRAKFFTDSIRLFILKPGTPRETRTPDLWFRKPTLYPTEL